ncbi:hypothetical protein D3C86_1679180 [compost metagenome]
MLDKADIEHLLAVIQLEQFQGCALFLAALHAFPETGQQLLHILFVGVAQLAEVQVIVAQRVVLAQSGAAGPVGQQLDAQRADLDEAEAFAP